MRFALLLAASLLCAGCAPSVPDLDQATDNSTLHKPMRWLPAGSRVVLDKVLRPERRTLLFFVGSF